MNNIKFRAWDIKDKKMIVNSTRKISFHGTIDGGNDFYKLMQYTGLKDINKEDIYNGDIVKNIKTGNIGKIIYSSKNASFEIEMINENRFHYKIDWFDEIKVIGNIYENKELLENE